MNWRWQLAQQLEWRWWLRYLQPKDPVSYLNWKRSYWHKMLENTDLHWPKGSSILDAGCGPAGIFMVLEHCQVDAVDPLLEQYAARLPHFDPALYQHVRFHAQALEDWTPRQQYDGVCCLNAINHVRDLQGSIQKLMAAAKPGAPLLVSIDAHRYRAFKFLLRWFPVDALHPHQYSEAEYRTMLENAGCRIRKSIRYQRGFWFDYYVLIAEKHGEAL